MLLFNLRLAKHVKGFGKPAVHAQERALTGFYVAGKPYGPNTAETREALPHYLRKAYDRANGAWWFVSGEEHKDAYCTLYGSRGQYLNTVYASTNILNR